MFAFEIAAAMVAVAAARQSDVARPALGLPLRAATDPRVQRQRCAR